MVKPPGLLLLLLVLVLLLVLALPAGGWLLAGRGAVAAVPADGARCARPALAAAKMLVASCSAMLMLWGPSTSLRWPKLQVI
jgi:hypothetical protein